MQIEIPESHASRRIKRRLTIEKLLIGPSFPHPEGLAYGQTETSALHKRIQFGESCEELLHITFRNSQSGVLHVEAQYLALKRIADLDIPPFGELHGIGELVVEHLRNPI